MDSTAHATADRSTRPTTDAATIESDRERTAPEISIGILVFPPDRSSGTETQPTDTSQ